jgi:hypothetical protein
MPLAAGAVLTVGARRPQGLNGFERKGIFYPVFADAGAD